MTKKYSDTDLMKLAIEEHLQSDKYPRVGAIIVKNGEILSTGHRGEVENLHAERVAIEKLDVVQLKGSIIYTTPKPVPATFPKTNKA